MDLKNKAKNAAKTIDTDKIKAQAKSATGEFNKLDNKKKRMIGGGVAVAVLAILGLSFGGGSNLGVVDQPFPAKGSIKEQCEFIGQFEADLMTAVISGASYDEIQVALKKHKEPMATPMLTKPHNFFIEKKESYKNKISRVFDEVQSPEGKEKLKEMDVEAKIEKDRKRTIKRCMNRS
ncbi:hypothetical protein AAIA71_11510 [Vibrio harveyi]|uniref:hypothetical protein n=1 Tax=Vibrio harveyi TaxID=669 RepID=UPI0031BAB030